MAESHGTFDPKFSDLVPSLKGESNWGVRKQCMDIALYSKDLTYWAVLVGQEKESHINLPGIEESDVEASEDTVTEIIDEPTAAFASQPATKKTDVTRRKKAQ